MLAVMIYMMKVLPTLCGELTCHTAKMNGVNRRRENLNHLCNGDGRSIYGQYWV